MKVYTLILLLAFLLGASAEQCGSQAGGAVCANGHYKKNQHFATCMDIIHVANRWPRVIGHVFYEC
jgi:hypothetical protein